MQLMGRVLPSEPELLQVAARNQLFTKEIDGNHLQPALFCGGAYWGPIFSFHVGQEIPVCRSGRAMLSQPCSLSLGLPMRPNESIPEPWLSFLRELDSAVHEEVRLDCMGGFVVSMVYGFSRPTGDLDVLEIAPREAGRPMLELGMQGGALHKRYKIYLDFVGVAHVPENYEDRLTEISPNVFKHLRLLALDPYDLALSKLERKFSVTETM